MIERARMYVQKLANGVNPTDGSEVPDGDVVNDVRISRCLFFVADVLRQVLENGGAAPAPKAEKKLPRRLQQVPRKLRFSHRAKVRAAALPAQTPYYIHTEETYNGTQSRYQG